MMTRHVAESGRLSLRTMLVFSLANLPVAAVGIGLAIFLPRHFASNLGVDLAVIGAAFAIVRLLDMGLDPLIGLAMDRTRTAIGRYRVWLLGGAPILMAACYALFLAKPGIGAGYLVAWLLVLYLSTSVLLLAFQAWGSTLATSYHDRSRLFGMAAPVAMAASLGVLGIPAMARAFGGDDGDAMRAMGWFLIAVTPAAAVAVAAFTPERLAPDVKTASTFWADAKALIRKPTLLRLFASQLALTMGPGWLSALYLFFANSVLGFTIPQASGLIAASVVGGAFGGPAFAWLSRHVGKHRALMMGAAGYAVGLLGFLLVGPGDLAVAAAVMACEGFMSAGYQLMVRAMMADVGDEVRLEHGKERIGFLFSLITMATKFSGAIAIGLTFSILSIVGFDATESATNSAEAINGLVLSFYIGPIAFVLLGAACFIGWELDASRHAEIRAALDERDAQMAEAQAATTEVARGSPPLIVAVRPD